MKTTITVNQENRPKGDLIEVPPIGLIENGGTVTVEGLTDEQAAWLATGHGIKVKQGNKSVDGAVLEEAPERFMYVAPEVLSGEAPTEEGAVADQINFSGGGEGE